ncbi:MAG TPA: flagellar hook-associated protein FlgK [Bacteroidetes bacterium]|nr:flagellar hook-associated protein FlgK [Bacteroidota bacterium]
MAGLNSILESAKRSLNANQYGIGVTSHNIANAGVAGYSRQRVMLSASQAEKTHYGFLGTGVDIKSIQRMREKYFDKQSYAINANLGQASQRQQVLSMTESLLQEPSDLGLSAQMSEFFNSFQNLATHPEESSSRNAVVQRASLMTNSFHRLSDGLTETKTNVSNELESKVEKINALLKSTAELNSAIVNASSQGLEPNDIKDQRDKNLSALSSLINIRVSEDDNGSLSVAIDGTTVISNGNYQQLKTGIVANSIVLTTLTSASPVNVTGGEAGGLMKLYNTTLNEYQTKLDELAQTLITQVNNIHSAGYTLGDPAVTGIDFFTGSDASSISINAVIEQDINNIAASADGAAGNNETAIALSKLQNALTMNGNKNTVFQFYNGIVSGMGSEIQGLEQETQSQQLVLDQVNSQQNSVSGVSLDEEMTNLIKFQHGFDASARVINTVNEMFDTLLQMG